MRLYAIGLHLSGEQQSASLGMLVRAGGLVLTYATVHTGARSLGFLLELRLC